VLNWISGSCLIQTQPSLNFLNECLTVVDTYGNRGEEPEMDKSGFYVMRSLAPGYQRLGRKDIRETPGTAPRPKLEGGLVGKAASLDIRINRTCLKLRACNREKTGLGKPRVAPAKAGE
jgi:hypothetical protein